MKTSEIAQTVTSGQPVAVVEFRDWSVKEAKGNVIESLFVLLGRKAISIERFAPKGAKVTDVVRPNFKPGQRVCWLIDTLESTKWGWRGRGDLQELVA